MSRVKSFLIRRIKSFKYAINGLKYVVNTQTNFKIHLTAAAISIALAAILKISTLEWISLTMTIFFVLICETINTVIEQIMDYLSPNFDKRVGLIKDIAAAAVLLSAIMAVVVGTIIFLPKLIAVF